jgi:hypothetical protein
MASWMMKKGIIKDESKAGNILIGIVILNFAITAFLIYYFIF